MPAFTTSFELVSEMGFAKGMASFGKGTASAVPPEGTAEAALAAEGQPSKSSSKRSLELTAIVLAMTILCLLSSGTVFGSAPPAGQQGVQQKTSASLRGTVRDAQGREVVSAGVHIESKDKTQIFDTRTDAQGNYVFFSLPYGTYSLRAVKNGYADATVSAIFLQPDTTKNVDLTLEPIKSGATAAPSSSQSSVATASASSAKFFDEPTFTVSGVTDTTSLGGHGSDTIVRTREALARETAALGKAPAEANPAADPAASAALEESLRERVEREPESFEANRQLGKCLLAEAKADEAIPYLDRARRISPTDYDSAYDLAFANFAAGNYQLSREQAQALLAHHDTAALHHLLADAQEKSGDSLDAVREYQRAAELEPSEPYLFDWGSELLLHHAPEPAIEVFTQGDRLFPKSARMLIGLGGASFERGDVDQAVKQISAAADLAPDDAAPYLFLGRIELSQNGANDGILAMVRRFAAAHPENAAADYFYAMALWKHAKAVPGATAAEADGTTVETLLRNALRIDPNFAAAHLQLGIMHSEKHDFEKAIAEFQQAIQPSTASSIDFLSTSEEAHYRLAQAYRAAGQPEKAKAELKLYNQMTKESAQKTEAERHQLGQFLYTLRDQPQNH